MARIVPSPDWFVGVHNIDLCEKESWLDAVTVGLAPVDAGTDNGYTFTSPNWPTEPATEIRPITSTQPNHPASSFYYPQYRELPSIAEVTIEKLEEFPLIRKTRNYVPEQKVDRSTFDNRPEGASDTVTKPKIAKEKINELDLNLSADNSPSWMTYPDFEKAQAKESSLHAETNVQFAINRSSPAVTSPKSDFSQEISTAQEPHKKGSRTKSHRRRERRRRRNCKVGSWSEWTPCTKHCGFGMKTRTRAVLREERNGGRPCPLLTEDKTCGSMKSCAWQYFSWS